MADKWTLSELSVIESDMLAVQYRQYGNFTLLYDGYNQDWFRRCYHRVFKDDLHLKTLGMAVQHKLIL